MTGARVGAVLDASPEAIALVLADPRTYDGVVVGSRRVRWFDARWPEVGTRFHHNVGFGPVTIRDHSEVVEEDLPDRLRLAVHIRPLGSAEVTFRVAPDPEGTRVEITEAPTSGLLAATWNPVAAAATRWRNRRVLVRLGKLARARAHAAALG
ncbi:MAG TPA: SRPBCC family protein [Acidimicrobiales bacterium]